MPGSITPLPVMLELDAEDRKIYEALEPPKTIVVRYGYQKMIAELPYDGEAKPGCGSKLVIRSPRGTEIAEMLTTTCANAGCAKSVTRKQMLQYISNSGGKDYPFTTEGKVLRVATIDDLNEQARLDRHKTEHIKLCKQYIYDLKLEMRLVDVEVLLGGEKVLFYYSADNWVDFRELVKLLASDLQTRIEMVQVNAREEARLVADYEKCGQHCCCKQFLKVLKPVSMRSAKVQKATLDPQKISGRCGRLMCCLRYEDQTYSDLKKNLPHRKTIVETEDGIGVVLDTQILTQLALVKVGMNPPAAYPVENLRTLEKDEAKAWRDAEAKREEELAAGRVPRGERGDRPRGPRPPERPRPEARQEPKWEPQAADESPVQEPMESDTPRTDEALAGASDVAPGSPEDGTKKRRRRRRKRKGGEGDAGGGVTSGGGASGGGASGGGGEPRRPQPGQPLRDDEVESREGAPSADLPAEERGSVGYSNQAPSEQGGEGDGQKKRRRRRRRRRGGGGQGGEAGGAPGGDPGGPPSGGGS